MSILPAAFIERMKKQLPEEEWEAFFAVYEGEHPSCKGLRVNPLKCSAAEFEKISPFPLRPVPWEKNGFYADAEKLGAHPYYFAGLYYPQEPSAMLPAPLLDVRPHERVLDLCAAPGGKGTQLAAAMQGEGLLVLNEPVFSRAQILSQNVERLGVKNSVVISEPPAKLAEFFGEYFDKILVDAPCSGEGMFRKNAREALGEWSEENVRLCAVRQSEILSEATKLLRPGGRLVYSTCTFSVEEDEGQVSDYLKNHSEMRLLKSEKFYPHKIAGEGHFAALFEKAEGAERTAPRPLRPRVSKEAERLYRAFEKEFFLSPFAETLHEAGGLLYALPEDTFDFSLLRVLRAGVRLGEVKNGRFEPSHSLAMCAERAECRNVLELCLSDVRVGRFLRGESVEADEKLKNGFCLVCVGGYPVGYGKAVNGTVKNHIPKALRRMSA